MYSISLKTIENISRNVNGAVAFGHKNRNMNAERNNVKKVGESSTIINSEPRGKENKSSVSVIVDDEGHQLVQKKKRRNNIVGSKRTNLNGTVRGATRVTDVYLGNCDLNVTSEAISEYISKEIKIFVNKCELLMSRN